MSLLVSYDENEVLWIKPSPAELKKRSSLFVSLFWEIGPEKIFDWSEKKEKKKKKLINYLGRRRSRQGKLTERENPVSTLNLLVLVGGFTSFGWKTFADKHFVNAERLINQSTNLT